jgi:hypothetical protein
MNVDKALANFCNSSELRRGGDTGRRRAEHRNSLQLRFTHHFVRYRLYLKWFKYKKYQALYGGCNGLPKRQEES